MCVFWCLGEVWRKKNFFSVSYIKGMPGHSVKYLGTSNHINSLRPLSNDASFVGYFQLNIISSMISRYSCNDVLE